MYLSRDWGNGAQLRTASGQHLLWHTWCGSRLYFGRIVYSGPPSRGYKLEARSTQPESVNLPSIYIISASGGTNSYNRDVLLLNFFWYRQEIGLIRNYASLQWIERDTNLPKQIDNFTGFSVAENNVTLAGVGRDGRLYSTLASSSSGFGETSGIPWFDCD